MTDRPIFRSRTSRSACLVVRASPGALALRSVTSCSTSMQRPNSGLSKANRRRRRAPAKEPISIRSWRWRDRPPRRCATFCRTCSLQGTRRRAMRRGFWSRNRTRNTICPPRSAASPTFSPRCSTPSEEDGRRVLKIRCRSTFAICRSLTTAVPVRSGSAAKRSGARWDSGGALTARCTSDPAKTSISNSSLAPSSAKPTNSASQSTSASLAIVVRLLSAQ
jgi:hypothetical protein